MIDKLIAAAKKAGEIILSAHDIENAVDEKSGTANFVTKYDVMVQEYLFDELKKSFPKAKFMGEENGADHLYENGLCFIIDPIDGTTNFIMNYRHSAVSIGLAQDGEMIAGVVYNPYMDEVFHAEKGKGAFLNGQKIEAVERSIAQSVVGYGTSPYYPDKMDATFKLVRDLYELSLDVRRSGSAALDLCYIACSRTGLFFETKLSPWDYAAASLIITEAGGSIGRIEGGDITFDKPCSVLAGNKKAAEEFHTRFSFK
ncbi:MAG: inositol monophosphatase [Clostridiales bacterium]|nr:inositol monophosphatase [Clostridiales bacterium]